jgi:hypothetical protein
VEEDVVFIDGGGEAPANDKDKQADDLMYIGDE